MVSQWGPNPQGVRSRPSRVVSLGDVRDLPVQAMGIDLEGARAYLEWSRKNPRPRGLLNEPADPRTVPDAARRWLDEITSGYWEDDINEGIRDDLDDEAKAQINVGDAELEWDDPLLDVERTSVGWERFREDVVDTEMDRLDQQLDRSADEVAAARAWEQARDDASVGDPEWDGFPAESVGLSDEDRRLMEQPGGFTAAPSMVSGPGGFSPPPRQLPNAGGFARSPALSGPGGFARSPLPPFLNTAMAGGGQESLPGTTPEEMQAEINRRGIAEGRGILGPPRTPAEEAAYERELKRRNSPSGPVREVPPLPPRPDNLNPQSQMSQQYLADMFARQAAQPQQGYFGGLGQAVGGMSTQQKIALLVGLGLIPMTGGASSSMLGPALGVGAGLAATQ